MTREAWKPNPAALLTGAGGDIEVSVSDRARIAIFQGGDAIVARGHRWSPSVKAALDRAERMGMSVGVVEEVDSEDILAIYEQRSQTSARSQIERQRLLGRLIGQAASEQASDIHIHTQSSYCEVRMRVHGRLRLVSSMSAEDGTALINAAFAVAIDQGSESDSRCFMKGALTRASGLLPPGIDLIRLQYAPLSGQGSSLVMRLKHSVHKSAGEIATLGYLPQQAAEFRLMWRRTSGLYLLAGKVSSGKTTTLQRVLNAMVEEKASEISVFAIEEPVELEISAAVHVAIAPRPGQLRSEAFVEALKAALRSDPNVVVLGELRDRDLAQRAIEIAMTGHALWSTVHAGSALGILDRLNDLGVEPWKLAEPAMLRGLVYQRLVGMLCRRCRITYAQGVHKGHLSADLAGRVARLANRSKDNLYLRGAGCEACRGGLTGRTVVAETVRPDSQILDAHLHGDRPAMRKHWLAQRKAGGLGGVPVMHHAMIKVAAGHCDINEIEEEIDLVLSYERDLPDQAARLPKDLASFETDQ